MNTKRLTSLLVSMIMLVAGFTLFSISSVQTVRAATLYVGGGGPGNYTTIQGAINAASSGDTIYVYNNVYVENLNINKRLTIIGQDKTGTIIDGGGSDVVYIQSDYVNITSFTITNGGRGVYVYFSEHVRIEDNIIRENTDGVMLYYSSNHNTVIDNYITSNSAEGVELNDDCFYNLVKNNTIDNHGGSGVLLTTSNLYNKIEHNVINNTYIGVYFYSGNTDNTVASNMVSNNTYYGTYFWSGNNNNLIYDNAFVLNVNQANDDGTNNWYNGYPIGGNFWDDHMGGDMYKGTGQSISGNDGICDSSYAIPGGSNIDKYPLYPKWEALYHYHPYPIDSEICEYAMGSLKVGVIFVESNGTIDPETENWDSARMSTVFTEINDALTWWENQEPSAGQSFSAIDLGIKNTSYEPITHDHTDEPLWVNEIMNNMGYTSGSYLDKVKSHNVDLRNNYGTDWAYTIFVIDSLNDADGYFADPNWCAFAYWDYGSVTLTYDNGLWGISRMNNVTAHETGHIFYATDEYNGYTESQGYLNADDNEGSGCLMDTNKLCLSGGTKLQIGWRDGDSDGVMDILDTLPNTNLERTTQAPAQGDTVYFTGNAVVVPYPNLNPQGSGRDVTLNTVSNVQYRIDNGTWYNASPADGAFDEPKEKYTFNISNIAGGNHLVETRAINSVGNHDTTPSNDTFSVAGIVSSVINLYLTAEARGWNFVSFNVSLSNTSLLAILEDPYNGISGSYDKVMYYDAQNGRWRTYVPTRPPHFNSLHNWDRTMGLWIQVNTDDVLTVNGTKPTSTTIPLYPGWNMVGYPCEVAKTASTCLPSEVTKIGVFNGAQQYNIEYNSDLANHTLSQNNAYWIYNGANYQVDWNVSNQ